jgi:hypothetical protein
MELFIRPLYDSMIEEINFIHNYDESLLFKIDKIIPLIQKTIISLKEFFLNLENINVEIEITFFKNEKPKFNALLIYYIELYNYEIQKPIGLEDKQIEYIKTQIQNLNQHKVDHLEFYKYLKTNVTYLDKIYYSRNNFDYRTKINSTCFEYDPRFSTSHDFLTATVSANELLLEYFENELINLSDKHSSSKPKNTSSSNLKWTSSKSNLIELIYAIHQTGCFNNGNSDIKQIASMFSEIFDINLGDFYRTYLDLKARNDRTKFIDQLRNNLENKMIDDDN